MKIQAIWDAEFEAKRFLERIAELENSETYGKNQRWNLPASPETAAVRRASMDLTRALARMRKY
jgi:hypothetical protein